MVSKSLSIVKKRFQLPKSTFSIVKLTAFKRKCNVIDRQNACFGELATENGIFDNQKSIDDGFVTNLFIIVLKLYLVCDTIIN